MSLTRPHRSLNAAVSVHAVYPGQVDSEVHRLIDITHSEVTELLRTHREQLDRLATALLDAETLDGIDAYRAAELPMQTTGTDQF